MTEKPRKTSRLPDSTWGAIIALLSPAYPDIDRQSLERFLEGEEEGEDDDKYIPVPEACAMLSCKPTTLWRLEKRGRIRAARPVPGKLLYSLRDLKGLLTS